MLRKLNTVLVLLTLCNFFFSSSQNVDHRKILAANPYLYSSDINFSLDTIPSRLVGQVLDFANNPLPFVFVTLEDRNGNYSYHYCDLEGRFFIPKPLLDQANAFVKIGCCSSERFSINSETENLKIKFQTGPQCLDTYEGNCNPIQADQYYINYMVNDVPFYLVQKGSEILKSTSVEVLFYISIDPDKRYINDLNKNYSGKDLIKLKQLSFQDWNDNLFRIK